MSEDLEELQEDVLTEEEQQEIEASYVIDAETAKQDVERWLDGIKVSKSDRVSKKDAIKGITTAVCEGLLVINDDFTLTHKLQFPVGEVQKDVLTQLNYKSRLAVGDPLPFLRRFKPDDVHGMIMAFVAALTVQPLGIITKLDRRDYKVCSNIATFFF